MACHLKLTEKEKQWEAVRRKSHLNRDKVSSSFIAILRCEDKVSSCFIAILCCEDKVSSCFIAILGAKMYTISSHTHQLQFIKLHHFKLERFKSI